MPATINSTKPTAGITQVFFFTNSDIQTLQDFLLFGPGGARLLLKH